MYIHLWELKWAGLWLSSEYRPVKKHNGKHKNTIDFWMVHQATEIYRSLPDCQSDLCEQ